LNEVAVFSDNDPFFAKSEGDNFVVGRAIAERKFMCLSRVMSVFFQPLHYPQW
jgi:hypothetical protein